MHGIFQRRYELDEESGFEGSDEDDDDDDGEEDGDEDGEDDGEEDGDEDGEEDGEEDGDEDGEEDGEEVDEKDNNEEEENEEGSINEAIGDGARRTKEENTENKNRGHEQVELSRPQSAQIFGISIRILGGIEPIVASIKSLCDHNVSMGTKSKGKKKKIVDASDETAMTLQVCAYLLLLHRL
jgi:hypothetical protein